LGENALLTLAPGRFVRVAEAGWAFVAPLKVVTAPAAIVFVRLPLTVMVAFRVMVQEVAAGRTPFAKMKVLLPAVPVSVPPQVPVFKLGGLAMIMPTGMLSVKVIPFRAELLGLIRRMLRTEDAPPKTVSGLNPFTTWMPIGSTRILAVAFATGLRVVAVP
jgi:hypothetical protein